MGNEKLQAKLYYLFMLADGKIAPEELDRFKEICKSANILDEDRKKIENSYQGLTIAKEQDNSSKIIAEISKVLSEDERNSWNRMSQSKRIQAQVIWTLINLGYADTDYSESEKKVIAFLVDYWSFDRELLEELLDTAETMLTLIKQKEWVKTTSCAYDTIHARIKHIDEMIEQLFKNIGIAISEAEIA